MPVTGADVHGVMPARWAFWRCGAESGVRNMAVDAALLRTATRHAIRDGGRAEGGHGVWRCYGWTGPTVSFGRNETTRGRFDAESIAASGLDAVRRPTGGRALLHAREITYSVAMPLADGLSWRAAYDAVNRLLVSSLHAAGFPAEIVPDQRSASRAPTAATDEARPVRSTVPLRPNGPLCFDAPSPGEITAHGMKLVASAVWREPGAYLQHGSILLHDDQDMLALASAGRVSAPPPSASLAGLIAGSAAAHGRAGAAPSAREEQLRDTVIGAMEQQLAAISVVTPFIAEASMSADIAAFEEQFASREWLWRR